MKSKSNAEQEKRKKQGRQERIRADRGMLSRTGVILILCGIVAFFACGGNAHQFDGLPPRRIF